MTEVLTRVELWTDGSSTGAVGDGGWAYILRWGDHEKIEVGYIPDTTNQRMEMTAVLMGLRAIKWPMPVTIFCDSAYVQNAWQQGWLKKWKKNGWMAGSGRKLHPVENRDLWEALVAEVDRHGVMWNKVKGHSGDELNERVDALARGARKKGPEAFVHVELPTAVTANQLAMT